MPLIAWETKGWILKETARDCAKMYAKLLVTRKAFIFWNKNIMVITPFILRLNYYYYYVVPGTTRVRSTVHPRFFYTCLYSTGLQDPNPASQLYPLGNILCTIPRFTSLEISSPGAPRVHPRFFRVTLG